MPQQRKRGQRREDYIDWLHSEAREVLLQDLNRNVLPLNESELSAEKAWDLCYVHMPEFANVVFDQFKTQLKAHREQVKKKVDAMNFQHEAFLHDRELHPVATHYSSGRKVFRHSTAWEKLVTDVKEGRHEALTPAALKATRPEYSEWPLSEFRQRIYQEVRRQKFVRYLEWKREQAKAKEAEKRGTVPEDNGYDVEDNQEEEE